MTNLNEVAKITAYYHNKFNIIVKIIFENRRNCGNILKMIKY